MLTAEKLHELFEYRDGNLYWKVSTPRKRMGSLAGTSKVHGYILVGIDGIRYKAHRLVWLMHKGSLPKFIDHINGFRHDNRIENLREASCQENCRNSKSRPSKSGVRGVGWDGSRGKWVVNLTLNGKFKNFGRFEDLELAELVATEARRKYHKNFFSER